MMDTHEAPQELRQLCDICQKVPFKEIQENPNNKFDSFDLGAYKELKKRTSCPFCCLVFELICEISRYAGHPDPDEYLEQEWVNDIKMSWNGHYFDPIISISRLRFTTGACDRLGRVVSPVPIDFDAITSLLRDCDASHQCSPPMPDEVSSKLTSLRAINVRQMCITAINPKARYIALSYVWGRAAVLYLVRANKEKLMKPHALEAYKDTLPLTIRDAIELARKMDIEYLWVDALCLIQDDNEDMTIGINTMSLIYEYAYLTVIAGGGLDAHAGLPGVSPREINQATTEVLPGVQLVAVCEVGSWLEEMKYSKRAWTFQEFHISRRKLIFLNGMVYYECIKTFWGEDREEPLVYPEFQSLMLAPIKPGWKIRELGKLILGYNTRESTYECDAVNAMVSVHQKILGSSYGGHLSGVPLIAFEPFLCFYTSDSGTDYFERRETLPSWAWSGWKGRMLWSMMKADAEILAWIVESTWIVWYIRDSARPPTLIWDAAASDRSMASAPTEQVLAERIAKIRHFSPEVLPTQPSRHIPLTFERQSDLLQFWTFSASFRLRVDRNGEKYLNDLEFAVWKVALEIYDQDDQYSGFVYVDEESSRYDDNAAELIVISKNAEYIPTDYAFVYGSKTPQARGEHAGWCNVLYIVEREGVAERKGYGLIYTDVTRLSPDLPWKWKEIVLG